MSAKKSKPVSKQADFLRKSFIQEAAYTTVSVLSGKRILPLVDEVELLYQRLLDLEQNIFSFDSQEIIPKDVALFQDEINELQEDFTAMLKALITLLDGAKYLWESKEM